MKNSRTSMRSKCQVIWHKKNICGIHSIIFISIRVNRKILICYVTLQYNYNEKSVRNAKKLT